MSGESSKAAVLQFSDQWFALGIVTAAQVEEFMRIYERGDDRRPEHYRWRAFIQFLADHRPLSPVLAKALYELGDQDPDTEMGGAIMGRIVRLPECPADVLAAAAASDRKHLRVLAARVRNGP